MAGAVPTLSAGTQALACSHTKEEAMFLILASLCLSLCLVFVYITLLASRASKPTLLTGDTTIGSAYVPLLLGFGSMGLEHFLFIERGPWTASPRAFPLLDASLPRSNQRASRQTPFS
jgi:hypothetical protein